MFVLCNVLFSNINSLSAVHSITKVCQGIKFSSAPHFQDTARKCECRTKDAVANNWSISSSWIDLSCPSRCNLKSYQSFWQASLCDGWKRSASEEETKFVSTPPSLSVPVSSVSAWSTSMHWWWASWGPGGSIKLVLHNHGSSYVRQQYIHTRGQWIQRYAEPVSLWWRQWPSK